MEQLEALLRENGLFYYGGVPASVFAYEDFKTAVVCLLPYYTEGEGNLARYARGRDYHRVARERLEPVCTALGEGAVWYCDVSPVDEVALAVSAGLGVRGENGLLLTERFGSYVFICELFMREALTEQRFLSSALMPPERTGCLACGRCVAACPTGALQAGLGADSSRRTVFLKARCLSHLSQKRGALSLEEEEALAKSPAIWGCDLCQTACPMAKPKAEGNDFFGEHLMFSLEESALEGLSDRAFRRVYGDRAFSYRGIGPLRRNLALQSGKRAGKAEAGDK